MDDFLTLTHATERDVDLIFIEELRCSPEFVRWLVGRVGGGTFERSSVSHSKRRTFNRREIDITLTLEQFDGRTVILIENKLDTSEQFQQAESYREEAKTLVARGDAALVLTVLICPDRYARTSSSFAEKFDHVLTYKEVIAFLAARKSVTGELAARLDHRRGLLEQAVVKARRGYEPVALAEIDQFAQLYVAMLKAERIDLEPGPAMIKKGLPGESRTMIFAPHALPKWPFLPQTRLVHQLREGNANVNFYTWGEHFTELAGQIGADLKGTGYRVVPSVNKRAGGRSGLMLVASTPSVNSLASFESQSAAIIEGARITAALKRWFWANEQTIKAWASTVAKLTSNTATR